MTAIRNTASAVAPLFGLSLAGILASAAFQVIVIRALGPNGFGLLAAYLALINVASIGSSAVRSSVAVGVARTDLHREGFKDRTLFESIVYGAGFAVVIAVMLATGAYPSVFAGALVLIAIVPYFIFARAQGLMQGDGHVTRVLVWSTSAQLLQLVFSILAVSLGFGWTGVLTASALVAVTAAVVSTLDTHKMRLASSVRPFMPVTLKALMITVLFTWLISMDVAWVRLFTSNEVAGNYSAATTIVKMAFLVPSTLALYLLPRFAKNLGDHAYQLRAVAWSGGAALFTGIALAVIVWSVPSVIPALLGEQYANIDSIAIGVAVAFIPWIVAQSVVTQLTARGSRASLVTLASAVVVQLVGAAVALPNIHMWIGIQGGLGCAVLGVLVSVFYFSRRESTRNSTDSRSDSHR